MSRIVVSLVAAAALCAWPVADASATPTPQNAQQSPVRITQGPRIEQVTPATAVIAWSTSVPSSSVVKYGTSPFRLDQTAQAPWGDVTHRVYLKSLRPNTNYWFRVESGQAQGTGTMARSNQQRFHTPDSAATARNRRYSMFPQGQAGGRNMQITQGPDIENVNANTATITWRTNLGSSAMVLYGTHPNHLNERAQAPWSSNGMHRVTLSNLQPGTRYYYRVESMQGQVTGTGSISRLQQFDTPAAFGLGAIQAQNQAGSQAEKAQITQGPVLETVTDRSAIVAWSTNVPASSVVKYGTDPHNLTQTAQQPWGGSTHRVQLDRLSPNTQYHFQVQSGQGLGTGTGAMSAVFSFQTVPQGAPARNNVPVR